jgi:hypothetical protein
VVSFNWNALPKSFGNGKAETFAERFLNDNIAYALDCGNVIILLIYGKNKNVFIARGFLARAIKTFLFFP